MVCGAVVHLLNLLSLEIAITYIVMIDVWYHVFIYKPDDAIPQSRQVTVHLPSVPLSSSFH